MLRVNCDLFWEVCGIAWSGQCYALVAGLCDVEEERAINYIKMGTYFRLNLKLNCQAQVP